MSKPLKQASMLITGIIVSLGFSLSLQSIIAAAWVAPTQNAPNNTLLELVNVGASGGQQIIDGDFEVLEGLSSDGTTFVVDDVNNRVGIGTNSPNYNLDVSGNIRGVGSFYVGDRDSTSFLVDSDSFRLMHGVDVADQCVGSTNGAVYFRMTDNGNFYIAGDRDCSDGYDEEFFLSVRGGNVGIGTSSPSGKLDVNGNIIGNAFFDKDDINFVADPNTTSRFNKLGVSQLCDEDYNNCIDMSETGEGETEDLNTGCKTVVYSANTTTYCPAGYLAVAGMATDGSLLSPENLEANGYIICCAHEE